ncbi:MAG: recombinase family protein, partial [Acutalibacteraceae bacterium]|nr:recombinase family protein [Acutalibacteraceae bacterium]
MKIAAAYIRVSTDDQVEYSPESQRKALYAYAKVHDMIIPEEYVFADEGISGRSTKRPAFQRMIGTAKLKPAPFEVILVWKFSRFARNREDSIVYKSMLRKQCGIEVVSVSEPVGEDKTSILIEALLEAMDEYYSINLAEEVVRGMSEKARRGGTLGRLAYGYRSEQGRAVIDEEAAAVVRKIFRDFDSGVPVKRIAVELNECGILTSKGLKWEGRTVEYILRNPYYIGTTHWTPEKVRGKHAETISEQTIVTEGTHTAIIDRELFDRCQERVAENKR